MKKIILSIFAVIALNACAISMPGITPESKFTHSHTGEELEFAKPFVTEVTYLSWAEMKKTNRSINPVHGLTVPNGDGTYQIMIVDYLSEEGAAEVYAHELGHIYRLAVLGVPIEEEVNHLIAWSTNSQPWD